MKKYKIDKVEEREGEMAPWTCRRQFAGSRQTEMNCQICLHVLCSGDVFLKKQQKTEML